MSQEVTTREVVANNIRFALSEYGDGDRLALCLHGFPEGRFVWNQQLSLLRNLGYRVWAPDLRGYGDSERPKGVKNYTIEKLLDDIAGLIDVAECSSVTLIAHDWGAMLAWYVTMHRIRPVEKLIILNCPHPEIFSRGVRNPKQLLRSWYALFFQLPYLPELILSRKRGFVVAEGIRNTTVNREQFSDELLARYARNASSPNRVRGMLNYYRAFVRGGGGLRMRKLGYPKIAIPTLMIWGAQDIALRQELTAGHDRFVEDFQLHILPNASHWVQQDAPEEVNQIMNEWLLR